MRTALFRCRCSFCDGVRIWEKGIGRHAPTTPLDLTLIIASGALSLDPAQHGPDVVDVLVTSGQPIF